MENNLTIFSNPDFGEIRTILIDNEPWFVGRDVAKILGYLDANSALKRHIDEEDKMGGQNGAPYIWDTAGRKIYPIFINESGVYALIFGSKLESAKKFKHWVTHEVLPSIRKTGSYNTADNIPKTTAGQIQLLAKGYTELEERVTSMEKKFNSFEMDLPLLPTEADRVTMVVRNTGTKILGGKDSSAYSDRSVRMCVYQDLYWSLKHNFGVSSYKDIKRNQCDEAITFIRGYEPPTRICNMVYEANRI